MPAVLDAVENYCTLGEISDELRSVYGEYKGV
jgi:methylmalonyl-CoA mutase N-terminal domain/subunit